jgi:hypothetical protein
LSFISNRCCLWASLLAQTETLVAKRESESLAGTERLMEEVCELENSMQALQRVKANKGSPGVDGMTVEQLSEYLKQHGMLILRGMENLGLYLLILKADTRLLFSVTFYVLILNADKGVVFLSICMC